MSQKLNWIGRLLHMFEDAAGVFTVLSESL